MNSRFLVLLCRSAAFGALAFAAASGQPKPRPTLPPAPSDVAAPAADADELESGVRSRLLEKGTGQELIARNDCVVVRFVSWRRDGHLAATSGLRGQTETQCLKSMMPGVAIALRQMREGEKRRVWVPAGLTTQPDEDHPNPGPPLTIDLEVVKVLRAPRLPADFHQPPREARKTRSGVQVALLSHGPGGPHPAMSSRLRVNYTCWTSAGDVFETTAMSGHPAEVLLGTALPGWREAIPLLSAGDQARLWIPAALAYGDKPRSRKLPAGNLVCDVQLLSFR